MTLGEYLKIQRKIRNYTIRKVEKLTGVSNAYISQIETGNRHQPHPNILKKLAEAYNIPVKWLYEYAGYLLPEELDLDKEPDGIMELVGGMGMELRNFAGQLSQADKDKYRTEINLCDHIAGFIEFEIQKTLDKYKK